MKQNIKKKAKKYFQDEDFRLNEFKRQFEETTKTYNEKTKNFENAELEKNSHLRT